MEFDEKFAAFVSSVDACISVLAEKTRNGEPYKLNEPTARLLGHLMSARRDYDAAKQSAELTSNIPEGT